MKGYLAIVLDRQSHLELKKVLNKDEIRSLLPNDIRVKCHHVTLMFNVTDEAVAEHIGKYVTMNARSVYASNNCGAVTVQFDDPEIVSLAKNKYNHIALYTDEKTKPSFSNELIDKNSATDYIGMSLSGEIKFVAFQPQPMEFRAQEKLRIAASREVPKSQGTCCAGDPLTSEGKCRHCGDRL